RESTWLLIRYGLSRGRTRFGYIMVENSWRKRTSFQSLSDGALPLDELWAIRERAELTDDPLGGRQPLLSLSPGDQAILLARMGEWAYVEVQRGDAPARGFVPDTALAHPAWRDESRPFDLRASSWAPMALDYAVTREQYISYIHGGPPRARSFNAWVRLDSAESRAALETLSAFRVAAGRATCAGMPVELPSYGYTDENTRDWKGLHFLPKDGFSRATLDLTLEEGEDIANVTLACTRTRLDETAETILLPLRGVPMDMGYPEGGAAFTAITYTALRPDGSGDERPEKKDSAVRTLDEALRYDLYQPMPGLPDAVGNLPYDTQEYALYLIEGAIAKKPGDFGVYDVTFALDDPPEGVYLSAYKECGSCDEIDAFDMIGDDIYTPNGLWESWDDFNGKMRETLERDFCILLLADSGKYGPEQLDEVVRNLRVAATFSGEKWNMSYEQHYITTAIGPRSSEWVDMRGIVRVEGVLDGMPRPY
ncbi:MAG TPA: hypothetical protein VLA21_02500, partial [Candidatus Limnocylindria bacterium]|nr:hypothetical protein [Candidatus Limnocylindria bacterium]